MRASSGSYSHVTSPSLNARCAPTSSCPAHSAAAPAHWQPPVPPCRPAVYAAGATASDTSLLAVLATCEAPYSRTPYCRTWYESEAISAWYCPTWLQAAATMIHTAIHLPPTCRVRTYGRLRARPQRTIGVLRTQKSTRQFLVPNPVYPIAPAPMPHLFLTTS